jgi:hypothetical protein
MTHPNKAKGTRWESAVRDFLSVRLGHRVERIPAGAAEDRGDLAGLPGVCVECKDVARVELSSIVDEAANEARNCGGGTLPVAVVKRRRRTTDDSYAVMPLWAWADLYARAYPGQEGPPC